MDFTLYRPNENELLLNKIYREAGINYTSDMDIELIANIFDAEVGFYDGEPVVEYNDDDCTILLNENESKPKQRFDFFHELSHPLLHMGCQDNMHPAFKELQEIQASQFQLYASMPIYMFDEFRDVRPSHLVKALSEAFVLPERFVKKRLEQIKNRIYMHEQSIEFNKRLYQKVTVTKEEFESFIEETARRYRERFGS